MRIVSVMTSSTRGGAEYADVAAAGAVAARGHEVMLLTNDPDTAEGTRVAARHVDLGPKLGARSWPRLALRGRCCAAACAASGARGPFDVMLLHFKKEQLLARGCRRSCAGAGLGRVGAGAADAARRAARPAVPRRARGASRRCCRVGGHPESLIAAGVPADARRRRAERDRPGALQAAARHRRRAPAQARQSRLTRS